MTVELAFSSGRARSILADLIRQRQTMRHEKTNESLLEANRLAIVYWQWQLSRLLLQEHEHDQSDGLTGQSVSGGHIGTGAATAR